MTPQEFLVVNIVLGCLMAAIFLFRRKNSPTPLNFDQTNPNKTADISSPNTVQKYQYTGVKYQPRQPNLDSAKNLNVVFNYNGHSWDAYEVLGIPAGSSIENVQKAYLNAIQSAQKDSAQFLTTAFEAIVTSQKIKKQ